MLEICPMALKKPAPGRAATDTFTANARPAVAWCRNEKEFLWNDLKTCSILSMS